MTASSRLLTLTIAALLTLTSGTVLADTAIAPADQRVDLSLADLLNIYSRLATLTVSDQLSGSDFTSVQVLLLNADGKTVVDFVVGDSEGRKMQRKGAGEATKSLEDMHALLFGLLRSPESALSVEGGEGHLRAPPTAASGFVQLWLSSRTPDDFLTQYRFERDGSKHVYATVDAHGVHFNADAPAP